MKTPRMARWAAVACALALGLGPVARRVVAQPPWAVSIQPAVRLRPIAIDRGAAALWQSLLKLHTRASMLMIDAHPDDEDGGLLAYQSRGRGARVALLTLNRGESGQNLMSSDLFDALGLVRTEELLNADQYYGSQQYFTPVIDFGFSKSKAETFQKWGHQQTLAEVVRVIRMDRPLVLTSVFVGGPSDGHGHHQASGELTQEAFRDAGNPRMFPDQIREGLRPWTPLKDYARVPTFAIRADHIWDYANGHTYPLRFYNYISGQWTDGMLSSDLVIPEGRYDPLLGGSFIQIGREGLNFQKSQIGGVTPPPPGPADVAYHLFGSRVQAPAGDHSMFAGIDVSLLGIADLAGGHNNAFLKTGLETINRDVEQAMHQFDARRPDAIAPLLADGAKADIALIARVQASSLDAEAKYNVLHELRIKQAQFNTALAQSLGLSVRASVTTGEATASPFGRFRPPVTPRVAIAGETIHVRVRAADQSGIPVSIRRVWIDTPQGEAWGVAPEGKAPGLLGTGQVAAENFQVHVAEDAKPTRPYFSRTSPEQNTYTIDDPQYLDLPLAPYPVSGWMEFEYAGVPVRVGQVAQTFERKIGFGYVAEPLAVAPAISLWISPRGRVVPLGAKSFHLAILVHSNVAATAKGTVRLRLPAGWLATPGAAPFSVAENGQDETIRFTVRPAALGKKPYELHAVAVYDGRRYAAGYERVGYPGLRPYYLYRPANFRVTGVDVKIAPGLKVGYVPGTGSQVPESLADLGVHTTSLDAQQIASGDLSRFNAIIIGVRAYSVEAALATYNQRLLDYVHRGGTLIVQYQAGTYDHNYGPYPLEVNATPTGTVTNEDSAVQFLLPGHPALTWPNRIGQADFSGWIEERGHSFALSWDPRWKALVEMHDPGQAPQKGGLLVARYGQGEYVYEALALYRQLPAGVPGSYRILANLLSLSANPALRPAGNTRRH